ncbi:MAG: polysaccharide pyruvyl transferase family protein [Fibromonadaceae bacterium]|jgi:hypothetical protein|nr:polysaccharide pyruvyl transferase family protein [Fibromonadaceae bacterium]
MKKYIYGIGYLADLTHSYLEKSKIEIEGFVSNNLMVYTKEQIFSTIIYPSNILLTQVKSKETKVVIASIPINEAVKKLKENGFSEEEFEISPILKDFKSESYSNRYGAIYCQGFFENYRGVNIGNEIQVIAAKQLLPQSPAIINYNEIAISPQISQPPINVIMNGYFSCLDEKIFPPSENIHPLYLSFHLNKTAAKFMLDEAGIKHLKKYSPIGCRDINTLNTLREKNIPCYYSSCLTLTLGETMGICKGIRQGIYFVDVHRPKFDKIKIKPFMLFKIPTYLKLYKNMAKQNYFYSKSFAKQMIHCIKFYTYYSNNFSDEILFKIEFVKHSRDFIDFKNQQERFVFAKSLLRKYKEAALVVTSRIHCALPCLSFETPVLFVTDKTSSFHDNRFEGIQNLFRTFVIGDTKMTATDEDTPVKISLTHLFKNKTDYMPLKDNLLKKVKYFISNLNHDVKSSVEK